MTLGFPVPGRVTHAALASYPLPVRRIRDFVISFLQIPPRDGHPCLDGWFRSLRSIGDFHPLNANHTEHTRRKRLPHLASKLLICCGGAGASACATTILRSFSASSLAGAGRLTA